MRYKTWEEECLPRLMVRREGSTALCVLWYLLEKIPFSDSSLNPAVVGNLRTPIGLSWFLRGLWQFPRITRIVLWGPDLTRTGEGLLRLWRDGITEDHRVPGEEFSWKIDPKIDREAIDFLREHVELCDARDLKLHELILDPPRAPDKAFREKKIFPPVEVPERVTFPSRGVFIPIVAKDPGKAWIEALNAVISCGNIRVSRKSEQQIHFFGLSLTFPVPEKHYIPEEFDLTPADHEIYFNNFLNAKRIGGNDYNYGERVFDYRNHNQVHELIARLRASLDTKRGTLAVLETSDIAELNDAPCWVHTTYSVNLSDRSLSSYNVFRSHDIYSGWPLNILTLLQLHRYIWMWLRDLDIKLGNFCVTSENAQIYERHAAAALERINRFGVTFDNVGAYVAFEQDPAGNFIFQILDSGKIKATMTSYRGDEILWEREHSDPGKLIRWVIAKHPWLKPDHIRYLGVEEEKLRQALRGGGEYVQG